MWLATTWDEAMRVATEPESFAADMPDSPIDRSFGSPTILTCDGERHRELRRSIDPKYRPHEVDGYIAELVDPIVARQLAAIDGPGEAELMAEYFEPVSVLSLGAVLGLADVDADTLRRWFAALADGGTNFERDPDKQARSDAACAEIDERLGPLLERLEREPDESTISHMIWSGTEDGRPRARERYLPSLKVILLGGMQEPGHGAGSVLYALLRHPQQLAEPRAAGEGLLPPAMVEGMRWMSPITWSSSVSAGPHTLDLYVANNNVTQPTNPTGLDFCFSVTYTTPPPPAVALFVIGNNQPHAIDDIVNFWGAQWWKHNPTSITSDNGWESFKGFAPVSDNVCGGKWSSGPGNSDPPPAAPLPSSINIIVTDKVNKNGNTLSGNIVQIITVTQDGHYQANPGHAGNGTVTAVLCTAR